MTSSTRHTPVPLIDWAKAIASQLIVWHHLMIYGPMREQVMPLAPDLFAWLADPARLAVQVFLVMGGFLAARALMPVPSRAGGVAPARLSALLWQRYARLVRPYAVALLLAVASAWVARMLMDDADTPAAPTLLQFAANALFLQDIVGRDALSAGLWYVAIDFQLFALLALLAALFAATGLRGRWLAGLAVFTLSALVAVSLAWANLRAGLDMWAPYFFGSYGLGVLAHWVAQRPSRLSKTAGVAGLLMLTALALWLSWRSRIALAGALALLLALNPGRQWLAGTVLHPLMAWLARISYSVFLAHYPVSLLVASVVTWLAPESLELNLLGLLATWLGSLIAGQALYRFVESATWRSVASLPQVLPSVRFAASTPGRDA